MEVPQDEPLAHLGEAGVSAEAGILQPRHGVIVLRRRHDVITHVVYAHLLQVEHVVLIGQHEDGEYVVVIQVDDARVEISEEVLEHLNARRLLPQSDPRLTAVDPALVRQHHSEDIAGAAQDHLLEVVDTRSDDDLNIAQFTVVIQRRYLLEKRRRVVNDLAVLLTETSLHHVLSKPRCHVFAFTTVHAAAGAMSVGVVVW